MISSSFALFIIIITAILTIISGNLSSFSSVCHAQGIDDGSNHPPQPAPVIIQILDMTVTLQAIPAQEDLCEISFRSSSSNKRYMAVGVSEKNMIGPLVGCKFPSSSSSVNCVEMLGEPNDAHISPTTFFVTSASVNNSGDAEIKLRIPMKTLGITVERGMIRYIFARGDWKDGSKNYMGHHQDHWAEVGVDLYRSTLSQSDDGGFDYIALFVALLASVCLALIGAALKEVHQRSGTVISRGIHVATWGCLVVIFVLYLITQYRGYSKNWSPAPVARALGSGVGFLFALMFLPTTHYLNIGCIAGSSFDRFINYHVIGGVVVAATIFAHAFLMFWKFSSFGGGGSFGSIIFSMGEGVQPVLPATLGNLVFLLFFILAIARGSWIPYYWFRISHYFFPIFLIAFAIHWPPLVVCIAPSLTLYVVDVVLRFRRPTIEDPQITQLEVEEESRVVKMVVTLQSKDQGTFKRWKASHSGQYVFISFRCVSEIPHPFTFLNRSEDGSQITFFIRSATGSFTRELFLLAKKSPEILLNKQGLIRQFTGPLGNTEIDVNYPTHVVLVASGVGATATVGYLYHFVENIERKLSKMRSIHFVWVVREPGLAKMILPHIEACSLRLKSIIPSSDHKMLFSANIFITGKTTNENLIPSTTDECIQFSYGRRPSAVDIAPIFSSSERIIDDAENPTTTSTSSGKDIVKAYFSCGKEAILEMARKAAEAVGAAIHEERYDL